MFTVLICSETIIRDCQKTYSAFLKPLLEQPDWSFCEWNPDGDTLDEAVPALRSIVAKHKDWRAVIVNDRTLCGMEGIEKMNPFNVAGSVSSKVSTENCLPYFGSRRHVPARERAEPYTEV